MIQPNRHCSEYEHAHQSYTTLRKAVQFDKNGELFWHINTFTDDVPKQLMVLMLKDIIEEINYHIFPLRLMSTEHKERAYIQMYFTANNKPDWPQPKQPFNPDELAVAYYLDGELFFNDDYLFMLKAETGSFWIKPIGIHEVLHLLGVGHTDVEPDLMYPTYNPGGVITADTISAIHMLYGEQMEKFNKPVIKRKGCISRSLFSGK